MRLFEMLDIVIFHIIIDSNILSKSNRYSKQIDYVLTFTAWQISNFGIISGIVGFKNSKSLKYSNLIYLWLIVFFYSLTIHYANPNFISPLKNIQYYFHIIYKNHWHITTYFGMYFFTHN